jgi:4-diphosphocytidyl-2-C-methyl-D-erythritol kinase
MIIKAHAKINIALDVLDKREDNYHNLDMVMVPLELHDSIDISVLPDIYDTYITCDDVSLETGEYNLCSIALKAMRERFKFKQQFRIHIHKSIPMSAGLGGGSSDAAAVLHGVCDLLKIHPDPKEMNELARKIGSDVPFCYSGIPARVGGVGEILQPITIAKKYYVLIVKPEEGLATKAVYAQYDLLEKNHVAVEDVVHALALGDNAMLARAMGNALEHPAFSLCEEVEKIKKSLQNDGFDMVLMSGSGSSVFVLSENSRKMLQAETKYSKQGYTVILTSLHLPEKK